MAQITTISLADGAATPVTHTFVPANPQSGNTPAQWLDKAPANPMAWNRISLSVIKNGNNVYKTRITIAAPVLASVPTGCCVDANTPQVSYTELCNIEFSSPQSSTVAQRADLWAFAKNFIPSAIVFSAVVNLETAW